MEFSLYFHKNDSPELTKTRFVHRSAGHTIEAARALYSGGYQLGNSFKWTSAVKALSLLCLCTKRQFLLASEPETEGALFVLEGEAGTMASSLDYALSKQTNWLLDVFGMDENGHAVARKLIRRTNPERKHAGPVALSLYSNVVHPANINIYLDGNAATCPDLLARMAHSIEFEFGKMNNSISSYPESPIAPRTIAKQKIQDEVKPEPQNLESLLENVFTQEVSQMLAYTDIFNRFRLKQTIERVRSCDLFNKLVREDTPLTAQIDQQLKYSDRLGTACDDAFLSRNLATDREINVAIPPALAASLAIFLHMKNAKGFSFNINYRFAHSLALVSALRNQTLSSPPEILVLGIAQGGKFFNEAQKLGYSPLMIMPRISQRIVTPKGQKNVHSLQGKRFLFMNDNASDAALYFSQLSKAKLLDKSRIELIDVEPHEASAILEEDDDDLRSIMWFPHYQLNAIFNDCGIIDNTKVAAIDKSNNINELTEFANSICFLFVHERFASDPKKVIALDIAIRDAWMTLKEQGNSVTDSVKSLLSDKTYVQRLLRYSGVFPNQSLENLNNIQPSMELSS